MDGESSRKMKMALFSNSKPETSGKSAGKKGGFKDDKKNLHYDFCNNNNHEEENYWTKHSELKSKKRKKEGKQRDIKFAISITIKPIPIIQSSKMNDNTE